MPASPDRLVRETDIRRTARDKGWRLTVTITAYDNGMIMVDDCPINEGPPYDAGHGWLGAAAITTQKIELLQRTARRNGPPSS